MHPTAPSDLDSLSQHMLQPLRSDLSERWAVARDLCKEAAAACARAAEVRHASGQCRARAQQLRTHFAQLRAARGR
jgi:hypothetical protein